MLPYERTRCRRHEKKTSAAHPQAGVWLLSFTYGVWALLELDSCCWPPQRGWSLPARRTCECIRSSIRRCKVSIIAYRGIVLTWLRWGRGYRPQPDLERLVQERDSDGLRRYLEPLEKADVECITVVDSIGVVLARLGAGQPNIHGDNVSNQLGTDQALSGRALGGFWRDQFGRYQESQYVPIYAGQSPTLIGVVILGMYLDGDYVKSEAQGAMTEMMLVYQDKVVAGTVTQQDGRTWVGQKAPAQVIQSERNASETDLITLQTGNGPYVFRFTPLWSPIQAVTGMYGVGVPVGYVDTQRGDLLRVLVLGLLAAVSGMSLVAFVSAHSLTAPIRSLRAAAAAMAAGELKTRIEPRSNDELGDLARQMDDLRQQLQQTIETSARQARHLAAILDEMSVAAVTTDRNHLIASVNVTAETLLGQDASALVGQPWPDCFVMNRAADGMVPPSWSKATPGSDADHLVVRGRFPLRHRPGTTLDVISSPVHVDGIPSGYVHVLSDVSEQEEFARTKDDFILNVAHELRGPLASVRVSIDLLAEDYAAMEKHDIGVMLKSLQKMVFRFQSLVETLVDVSNIKAGRFRVRPVAMDVEKLIRDAIEQTKPLVEARGQRLRTAVGAGTGLVMADPPRVTQVLVNLITNASKYGPEDSPIALSCFVEAEFVHIGVTDQGPGIPAAEQSLIFHRFYRTKRAEEEGAGIGIGLELARGIVEAHGGQLNLESAEGVGTTFWFSLPVAAAPSCDFPLRKLEKGNGDENPAGG